MGRCLVIAAVSAAAACAYHGRDASPDGGDDAPDARGAADAHPGPDSPPGTPDAMPADGDGDGVPDATDNCPGVANATQANYLAFLDVNGDGVVDSTDLGQFRIRFSSNVF